MMADLSGTTLGKYQVIERLGRGGMAEVYRAYQPSMDRYVAVKVMHAYLADDKDFTERFKREAKSVGALRHPNIVQVIDFDMADDVYYMVMEFIPGDTLKAMLERRGALPIGEALDFTIKLADALAYAHHEGMLHRDIKPANVLFTKGGEPVLTDFGVARIMGSTHLTASGAIVGTPAYMSPEAGRGDQVDARADIYSLGIVLYEMLTGAVPFDADTPYAVIFKHINDPLPMPRQYVPDLPDEIEALLLRSLAKDKEARYQTADQFLEALKAARQNLTHTLATAAGHRTAPPRAKAAGEKTVLAGQTGITARRAPRPAVFIALGVLIVGGLAIAILSSGILGSKNTPSTPTSAAVAVTPPGVTLTPEPTLSAIPQTGTVEPTVTSLPEKKYAALAVQVGQLMQTAQYDDALTLVQTALHDDPESYDLLVLRGLVLVQYRDSKEKLDSGKASAEAAVSIDANRPEAYVILGLYYNFTPVDDTDQALKYYTLAIEKGSDDFTPYFRRASINRYRSEVPKESVIADYDRAISLAPQNDDLFQERGTYYYSLGNLNQAQTDLEQSLRLNPTVYKHDQLAGIYIQNKQGEKAFVLYAGTIEAEKITDPGYLADGAFIAWTAGHPDKAAEWANLALLIEPKETKAIYVQALLARDSGSYADALALIKTIQQADTSTYSEPFLNPRFNHLVEVDQARTLVAAGRIDEALEVYNAVKDNLPYDWGQPYVELAQLYLQKGQLEEARNALLKALEISKFTQDEAFRQEVLDELEKVRQAGLDALTGAPATGEPTAAATPTSAP
jgi:serine/threonine protein kinase/Tfp pilus assembly protein PilF